ncbi:methyltransferase [Qipengyuania sp. G39]|uniref:Methyltransferase n=1 Tax=Qipengyuania profundimaris TaxID=3067652 RepID=A0ABT9HP83_9SPHN|nr:methyltransferase [Qipengyuania sp. G39]MDP4574950.1 methyltransferase [Qipengyuania sp. G39]
MKQGRSIEGLPPRTLRMRFLEWRNRVIGSDRFQRFAARNPLLRPVARQRASAVFDLVAGFTYSQVLLGMVESGILARLGTGPAAVDELSRIAGLPETGTKRLLRAAQAIGIAQEGKAGWWVLGRHGAVLHGNGGAIAMIRHHRLLYADLADPLALLADERRSDTQLANFWKYGAAKHGDPRSAAIAADYSELMADSQKAVAAEVLETFSFHRCTSLLDVGGGNGTFLRAVSEAHPHLRLGLFDLPDVVPLARAQVSESASHSALQFHEGDFLADPIPQGYELVSLVRILHDHDDEPARQLLENIRRALAPGARLLIAEPMAETSGAEGMGDAYFGMYLWAMGSGRPRSAREIRGMLEEVGFSATRQLRTSQPLITSVVVATA